MTVSALCDCGHLLRAEDQYAGKKARCPKCSQVVRLPLASDEAAERSPSQSMNFASWQTATPETSSTPSSQFAQISAAKAAAPPQPSSIGATPGRVPVEIDEDAGAPGDLPNADAADFRKRFFGVYVCQLAFRIMAALWISISIIAEAGMIVLMAFSLIMIATNKGLDAAQSAAVVQLMAAAVFTAWCVAAFIIGCWLLAMSELLHAAGWWLYRQRIGGLGPF